MLVCFSELKQDGYHDPALESIHTVPSSYSFSGVEDEAYSWSSADPSLIDVVCDDNNIVAGREIVLMCFHILSTNVVSDFIK